MSKFNFKNTDKTVNRDGFPAYKMQDKEQLVTAVLTTMFGEPKFYGSTDEDIFVLATVICGEERRMNIPARCSAISSSVPTISPRSWRATSRCTASRSRMR